MPNFIVKGRSYSTDRSVAVASYGYYSDDEIAYEATIYRTRAGAFFTVHETEERSSIEVMTMDCLKRLIETTDGLQIITDGILPEQQEADGAVIEAEAETARAKRDSLLLAIGSGASQ